MLVSTAIREPDDSEYASRNALIDRHCHLAPKIVRTLFVAPPAGTEWGELESVAHAALIRAASCEGPIRSFRPFACKAMHNALLSFLRARRSRLNHQIVSYDAIPEMKETLCDEGIEASILDRWQHRRLLEIVDGLPLRQRMVLRAYYLEGLTMPEIARHLGCQTSAVSKLHQKALRHVRRLGTEVMA